MELKNNIDAIRLVGISTMKVWEAGAIPRLMEEEGLELPEAIARAEELGLMVHKSVVKNLVTTVGLRMVGDLLIDDETTGITYHAIGTDATAPASGDTTLGSEQNRKQVTTRTRASQTITLSTFYSSSESTYNIAECGLFGGASATASADTGILFSHYAETYDNSSGSYDLTFEYEVTVTYV